MNRMMLRHFLLFLLVLYFLWFLSRSRPSKNVLDAPFLEDYSLTVVLPVIQNSLTDLDQLLAPFLVSTAIIYEVAIVCPHSLVSDMSLYPSSGTELIPRVKSPWILLLDEHGLNQVTECYRAYLLRPRAVHLPVGPRGFTGSSHNWIPLSPSGRVQSAVFLIPPFIAPAALLEKAPFTSSSSIWPVLGDYIATSTTSSFGGLVIGADLLACIADVTTFDKAPSDDPDSHTPASPASVPISPLGFFVLAFPREDDLRHFHPAACKLSHQGYTLLAYLYDADASGVLVQGNCTIPYFRPSKETHSLSDWLNSFGSVPDMMIGLDHRDSVSSTFALILESPPFLNTTLMRLPRSALPYTEWIGTLTLYELRRSSFFFPRLILHSCQAQIGTFPELTLSVITNNRPHSLRRLLESIQRTLFYGDKVNIRINMDQKSDPETVRLVQHFEWLHGDVFLHHRVVHGGLLPAVVESWYPHCDDAYGLLLEDDTELSPMSYAWLKMTLLRYKYGTANPTSANLFGISLYQQKIIELRPPGRQPFNAHALFQSAALDPSTPWGALYFPAPWRDFHAYLVHRLAQPHTRIVPGVRSNIWSKSWKKYFIELVYLRGYCDGVSQLRWVRVVVDEPSRGGVACAGRAGGGVSAEEGAFFVAVDGIGRRVGER
ncbi:hypothetical protein JVU11DRAFT_6224 [Chiua virens]|nr:hypothetical protein JVU11DRAFT_6224 [Chiua virens]